MNLEAQFRSSVWHDLATVLSQGDRLTPKTTKARFYMSENQTLLKVLTPDGNVVITYGSANGDRNRFAERLGAFSSEGDEQVPDRAEILHRLGLLTMTDSERQLDDLKMKSRRQALEGSLWFRLAYHCFLEFGIDGCRFHPSVDEATGTFIMTCKTPQRGTIFHASIARNRVRPLLDAFRQHLPNQHDLPIHPIPLKSLFRGSQHTETDLDIYPVIQLLQAEGEQRFFSREGLERFIYGDIVYIPELKLLAELEKPGNARQFSTPRRMTFKHYQIPSFLESVGDELDGDRFVIDPDVKGLQLLRRWNTMTLAPTAIDKDWCWLSITYGFGDQSVSLADLLRARREATRYIGTASGWVDTQSPAIETMAALAVTLPPDRFSEKEDTVRLSRQELIQFSALEGNEPIVAGTDASAGRLSRFLGMESASPPENPGLTTALRKYQRAGLKWLWWLRENRLGGLLCDDMGLGKTHQIMAMMACIQQRDKEKKPFLVVCPTTVLSHWMLKLKQHAPTLKTIVYYGGDRDLSAAMQDTEVLITSYGLLLRDIDQLREIPFSLGVFDEIQYIKNADTKTHVAARQFNAAVKLGLTGTPIENSILELKALMDVVAPGYLGSDQAFCQRFVPETTVDRTTSQNREQLRRLIFPFTLRRLKSRVLDELPEKIEDIRFCELTERQVKLYRDAIDSRAKGLVSSLKDENTAIPFIPIFALLTLLKQICNHPALVDKQPAHPDRQDSGKWELFKELLEESLTSGQKVVVYSQFTEMIAIIAAHLDRSGIGHVVLTGASRNRGRLIETFNTEPDCRVFVGSLKAGGTGIDLVAGSVVIHYDRWWNAAKEDQATDRVHRIGQRRGVQVFKLVTLGTLEEKISAIIEKKRKLMADIVREDDPGLLKSFNRQELLAFLS
ncbi:MAG: DEAD/DEAH box helicase [Deltaproteobacteria bacterium]|nr:DEAD/DEAH box helicase [Deltaproteobacteria bacterium]